MSDEREHDLIEGETRCWCNPRIEHICPECGGYGSLTCWRCNGEAWVVCDAPDVCDEAHVIIHSDTDGTKITTFIERAESGDDA